MKKRETWKRLVAARQRKACDHQPHRRVLDTAASVFAEKGFRATTAREICARAGTHTAAVNYYFGGMEALYAAVVENAYQHLIPTDPGPEPLVESTDARAKLEAIVGFVVQNLMGAESSSSALRILVREAIAPSLAEDEIWRQVWLPWIATLRSTVSELMGLPEEHADVGRGCVSVLAPCFLLLVVDRRTLTAAVPGFGFASEHSDDMIRHLVQFALAGLSAVARPARDER